MTNNVEQIGPYLKTAREEAKLTQLELAKRLGVTPRYVSDLETGRRQPSLEVFFNIADITKVGLDRLAGRKP